MVITKRKRREGRDARDGVYTTPWLWQISSLAPRLATPIATPPTGTPIVVCRSRQAVGPGHHTLILTTTARAAQRVYSSATTSEPTGGSQRPR